VLAAACFLLHLVVNNRYDVFRDELYFIVCGQHPAPGYVDQPPLIPLIAGASHALFGTALLPLRLVPALAMSATVALAVEFVRLLGGGRFAQGPRAGAGGWQWGGGQGQGLLQFLGQCGPGGEREILMRGKGFDFTKHLGIRG
jgi:hypothetical protein